YAHIPDILQKGYDVSEGRQTQTRYGWMDPTIDDLIDFAVLEALRQGHPAGVRRGDAMLVARERPLGARDALRRLVVVGLHGEHGISLPGIIGTAGPRQGEAGRLWLSGTANVHRPHHTVDGCLRHLQRHPRCWDIKLPAYPGHGKTHVKRKGQSQPSGAGVG